MWLLIKFAGAKRRIFIQMTRVTALQNRIVSASFLDLFSDRNEGDIALTFSSRDRITTSLTYGQLYERALQAARYIELEGGAGRPVVLLHGPGLEFLIDFLGCMLIGSQAIPLAPQLRANGLEASGESAP